MVRLVWVRQRLNPCYTGIYSTSELGMKLIVSELVGLNPCYTGIYSTRLMANNDELLLSLVLILVILEYTLRVRQD